MMVCILVERDGKKSRQSVLSRFEKAILAAARRKIAISGPRVAAAAISLTAALLQTEKEVYTSKRKRKKKKGKKQNFGFIASYLSLIHILTLPTIYSV